MKEVLDEVAYLHDKMTEAPAYIKQQVGGSCIYLRFLGRGRAGLQLLGSKRLLAWCYCRRACEVATNTHLVTSPITELLVRCVTCV